MTFCIQDLTRFKVCLFILLFFNSTFAFSHHSPTTDLDSIGVDFLEAKIFSQFQKLLDSKGRLTTESIDFLCTTSLKCPKHYKIEELDPETLPGVTVDKVFILKDNQEEKKQPGKPVYAFKTTKNSDICIREAEKLKVLNRTDIFDESKIAFLARKIELDSKLSQSLIDDLPMISAMIKSYIYPSKLSEKILECFLLLEAAQGEMYLNIIEKIKHGLLSLEESNETLTHIGRSFGAFHVLRASHLQVGFNHIQTTIHGDANKGNVFYNSSTGRITLIDNSQMRMGNPLVDVIALLTPLAVVSKEHWQNLVRITDVLTQKQIKRELGEPLSVTENWIREEIQTDLELRRGKTSLERERDLKFPEKLIQEFIIEQKLLEQSLMGIRSFVKAYKRMFPSFLHQDIENQLYEKFRVNSLTPKLISSKKYYNFIPVSQILKQFDFYSKSTKEEMTRAVGHQLGLIHSQSLDRKDIAYPDMISNGFGGPRTIRDHLYYGFVDKSVLLFPDDGSLKLRGKPIHDVHFLLSSLSHQAIQHRQNILGLSFGLTPAPSNNSDTEDKSLKLRQIKPFNERLEQSKKLFNETILSMETFIDAYVQTFPSTLQVLIKNYLSIQYQLDSFHEFNTKMPLNGETD
jgi:tRNA A-37 threonylcarbamoyl transferase component Bud32